MEIAIWIAGFIAGVITPIIWRKALSSGTVEIDRADPEIPYLRLTLDGDQLDKLHKKKYVLFRIDANANFTRQKQSL